MKKILTFLSWTALSCPILFVSCQKDISSNKPDRNLAERVSRGENDADEIVLKLLKGLR